MVRAESGSITQLGKNRWRVRVSGGNDPVTGKRIRLSKVVHGTKKDAIAERTRMQIEVGDVDRVAKDMTVAQYFEEVFLPWHRGNVRKTSYIQDENRYKTYIRDNLGHIKLGKLSAYTVETWMKSLPTAYVQRVAFGVLRHAYKQAYKWDLVQRNFFDKLTPPKKEHSEKVVADGELAALIIGAMYGEPIEAPFLIEISCGTRMSEALAIDWEDIDFNSGKVHIYRSYQEVAGEGAQFFDVKTASSNRKVSIPPSVLERLKELRYEGGKVRFGPLCIGPDGNRLKPDTYRDRYRRIYKRKLPDQPYITPKNLRHSHATILLASGVDLKTISDRLGHADIRITADAYIQKVAKLDEGASDAFDAVVKVLGPNAEPKQNIIEFKPAKEA